LRRFFNPSFLNTEFDKTMQILIYGTINSVALALFALGFAMVYGVSRLPNFAHGALYVLSGFITWTFFNSLGLNYLISILLAMIISGIIGALIYQFVLIRIRGMEISEIMASYAMGLAILEGLRWAGFKGMTYTLPAFIGGSTEIAGVLVDYQRLLVVAIGAVVVGLLWLFTHYTRIGLALRGMAQDERAAMMLGIDSDWMAVAAMGFGSMLAALAAILLLPLGNIVVEAGYNVLILAIAVCIVGGLGSWMGAVLAAFLIGFAQILTVVYLGAHYQMVVALLAIILTLILRPSGLFGRQKELEERV
jgi:branched-chain amino acid transport system permease protein